MQVKAETYIRHQFRAFNNNLLDSVKPDHEISLHDFRVAAKRIRTLESVTKILSREPELVHYIRKAKIGEAMKSGGYLREVELHSSILAYWEKKMGINFHELRRYINSDQNKALKALYKCWEDYPHDACYRLEFKMIRDCKGVPDSIFRHNILLFMTLQYKRLKSLSSSFYLNRKLHLARKLLKDIKYCLEWQGLTSMVIEGKRLGLRQIDRIEDKIGSWHDWFTFKERIKNFIARKIKGGKEAERYYLLDQKTSEKLTEMEVSVINLLKKLCSNKTSGQAYQRIISD